MSDIDVDSWEYKMMSGMGDIKQAIVAIEGRLNNIESNTGDMKDIQRDCQKRLKKLEQAPSPCHTVCENRKRVVSLEDSRTWTTRTIIGIIITASGSFTVGAVLLLIKGNIIQ